jgi:thiamine monophosphate synthase
MSQIARDAPARSLRCEGACIYCCLQQLTSTSSDDLLATQKRNPRTNQANFDQHNRLTEAGKKNKAARVIAQRHDVFERLVAVRVHVDQVELHQLAETRRLNRPNQLGLAFERLGRVRRACVAPLRPPRIKRWRNSSTQPSQDSSRT